MIKPLRKTHRYTWLVLAMLLPAGIICSWLVIPDPAPVALLAKPAHKLLPLMQAKTESAQHCIHIRSDFNKADWQIEWKNKLPLTVPSAVIYQGWHTSSNKGRLIGRIEATGEYVFPLQPDSTWENELNLVVYDFIHDRVIDSLNFKINR
ncbi:MAG TPA: hypothetical protein VD993_18005 [Chitinophagaceae bacterium]|nr:hypothetical protein [Chitinophagaceae bacterium]